MRLTFAIVALCCSAPACGDTAAGNDGGNDGGDARDARDASQDVARADASADVTTMADASDARALDARAFDVSVDTGSDAGAETANLLLSWNDGLGLRVIPPEGSGPDGYIRGGDFDHALWASDDMSSWRMLHVAGGATPTEDFARVTLPTLPGRRGALTTVLKMALLMDAPSADNEQIGFLEQQASGRAGDIDIDVPSHALVEPVFYQRQWIKFSPETRTRAGVIGEDDFTQVFWEMRAEPDYRLRVQLSYSEAIGLLLRAHDDVLTGNEPVHVDSGLVPVGTIDMADEDIPVGWHLFEVWVDRTRGDGSRWRVSFSGFEILDYTGPLMGESGNVINTAMIVQIHSEATDLAVSPFYQLVDGMEIWDAPPRDAFR